MHQAASKEAFKVSDLFKKTVITIPDIPNYVNTTAELEVDASSRVPPWYCLQMTCKNHHLLYRYHLYSALPSVCWMDGSSLDLCR